MSAKMFPMYDVTLRIPCWVIQAGESVYEVWRVGGGSNCRIYGVHEMRTIYSWEQLRPAEAK